MFKELPPRLKKGDKVVCSRWYNPPEIYEVVKVDGDFIWLMSSLGVMIYKEVTMDTLYAWDFKLWEEGE